MYWGMRLQVFLHARIPLFETSKIKLKKINFSPKTTENGRLVRCNFQNFPGGGHVFPRGGRQSLGLHLPIWNVDPDLSAPAFSGRQLRSNSVPCTFFLLGEWQYEQFVISNEWWIPVRLARAGHEANLPLADTPPWRAETRPSDR